jgi:hypothetical protein
MKKPPTDLEILSKIYDRYYEMFAAHSKETPTRDSKILVPVDLSSIASGFGMDADIIFGRLYYRLNKKHGYKNDDGSRVDLFTPQAGKDRHCVNFPLLASIVADLREDRKKFLVATTLAIVSLCISVTSIIIAAWRSSGK